jgi:Zn-dependent protease/CBS domain-containing protein
VFLTWVIGARIGLYVRVFDLPIDPAPLQRGLTPWLLGLGSALGLVVSVLVHELSHALTARRFGVEIKEITLWILGGIAQFSEMPKRPGAEAIVAIVGPLTSLLLGGLFWAVTLLISPAYPGVLFIASYLAVINVVLAVFNLIPALPMDGGRVLRSLLALRGDYLRATKVSARVSQVIAVLMGLFGLLSLNLLLMAIAFFVFFAVQAETQYATISQALEDIRVADLMTTDVVTVEPEMQVRDFIRFMFLHKHLGYPVEDAEGRLLGMVTLRNAEGASEEATVSQVMSRDVSRIRQGESAVDAFKRIQENDSRRLVVTDGQDRMIGILSPTDLVRAVQVRLVGQAMDESRTRGAGREEEAGEGRLA